MGGNVSKNPIRSSHNATRHHTRKESSRRPHAGWSAAHATSHAMTGMLVLPTSGPTGGHQFNAFRIPALSSAKNVHRPNTNTPKLAATIAARAGPLGFSIGTVV